MDVSPPDPEVSPQHVRIQGGPYPPSCPWAGEAPPEGQGDGSFLHPLCLLRRVGDPDGPNSGRTLFNPVLLGKSEIAA